MQKRAIITGVYGQDGSYLAEFLLDKGYIVYGLNRPKHTTKIPEYMYPILQHDNFSVHSVDITDAHAVYRVIDSIRPRELYNMAAISFVPESWSHPELVTNINFKGLLNIVEAICLLSPETRLYQASTSEMYGNVDEVPQNEKTKFVPESPYAIAKLASHGLISNYREAYDLFMVSGIAFNHESPRRRKEFVTRKITSAAAMIKKGLQDKLLLGNLDARRDWGFSGDYVEAMWKMLQNDEPEDFVIGTGISYSVRDFCRMAFDRLNLNYEDYVVVSDDFMRPIDVNNLCADPSMIEQRLNWVASCSVSDLIDMMITNDMAYTGWRS